MLVVLSKLILPKISENLETRKSQILENVEAAEKQREESDTKLKEYEKIIIDSINEAKNYKREFAANHDYVIVKMDEKYNVYNMQLDK